MVSVPNVSTLCTLLALSVLSATALAADGNKFELDGNRLVVPGPVVFETGSAVIKAESDAVLYHVKAFLDAKDYITTMRIEVHSDDSGSQQTNQTLTETRALAVARWLVAKGVDCKRLIPVGFGSSKPVASNNTPEGKASNRRTEFYNAAIKGRAIGGMPLDGGGQIAGDPCSK